MCILIDINCLASVFQTTSVEHSEFKPVLDWILNGKGRIIYGGTKYINEIPRKYLPILKTLKDVHLAKLIDTHQVDVYEKQLKSLDLGAFNDHHLVAIIAVSGCMLLCTQNISKSNDDLKQFKNKSLYPQNAKEPSIYRGKSNKNLLCDKYIPTSFKPAPSTTKAQRSTATKVFSNQGA